MGWGSKPKYYVLGAVDTNGDGMFDIVASGQEGNSNKTSAKIFLNEGKNTFSNKSIVALPEIKGYEDVSDIYDT